MYIAGLDIGTTGCKCTVFDGDGHLLGKAYRDYPVQRAVGGHEIDISAMRSEERRVGKSVHRLV